MASTEFFIIAEHYGGYDGNEVRVENVTATNARRAAEKYAKAHDFQGRLYVVEEMTIVDVKRKVRHTITVNPGTSEVEVD